MAEFFNVISPSDAVSLMTSKLIPVGKEIVDTSNALGRVSFSEIKAEDQSTEEGFWDNRPDIDNLLDDKGEKE